MHRPKVPLTLSCLALLNVVTFPSLSESAEPSNNTLPEVVVTATEAPVTPATPPPDASIAAPSAATAQEQLKSNPGTASVVTRASFDQGRGSYLEDFVRYQPGLLIQSSQGSEDTKVSSRGSGIQEDDDILGMAILLDGIPVNQADGQAFLQDLDLQSIKYTEVYRGADALRYGSITLGGAINLVSMTGHDTSPLTLRSTFGSYGLAEQQASSGWTHGQWDAYVSVLNHTLDGFQAWSQENFQKVTFSLGYKFNDNAENRLYFFWGRLDQHTPSGLTKDELYSNPRQTDPEAIQERWGVKWSFYRVMDRFVLKGDDWQLSLALSWNHRSQTQRQEFEEDFRLGAERFYSDDYDADLAFESKADLFGQKNRFSIGVVPMFEPESDSFYANPKGEIGPLLYGDRTYSLNLPFYAENQHYFTKQISLLTGFQVAYVNRIYKDRFKSPTLGDQSHDTHYLGFNPKVGLAYEWNDKCLAFLNFSRSFQPPSIEQSIGIEEGEDGGQVFNPLHAQKAWTIELGTRGESGPISWDLALYRSWVRDELLELNNAQGQPLGTVNVEKSIHQGLEVGLEAELAHSIFVKDIANSALSDGKSIKEEKKTDKLVLEQTYNLSDFRFANDTVYANNRIAGNPEHFYKAELRYEHPTGFYLGVNVEWNITKYPVDEANTLFADPYALLGIRAGYKTKKGLQLYFEARNLTDKTYAAVVEPIADARISDDVASFHPGVGRAFYGGVSWVW